MGDLGQDKSVVVDVDSSSTELAISHMKKKLRERKGSSTRYDTCTIYRIIRYVQEEYKDYYCPKVISIGPLHHGDARLEPMQDIKWRYLDDLLHRCASDDALDLLFNAVKHLEASVKAHYSEPVDSDGFLEMLVLDGCFIIEFIMKWHSGDIRCHLRVANWSLILLRRDLLLLQNQIPFIVPQALFSIVLSLVNSIPFDNFTHMALTYLTKKKKQLYFQPKVEPYHLLHLYHMSIDPELEPRSQKSHRYGSKTCYIKDVIVRAFASTIRLVLKSNPAFRGFSGNGSGSTRIGRLDKAIPGAAELKEAGVTLKKKECESHDFLKVEFKRGKLLIPPLDVNTSLVSLFLNLLAFEQCRPDAGNYFMWYAAFMDNIINTPQDVATLRSCWVIKGQLGSDQEVALFFNSLGGGVPLHRIHEENYMEEVIKEIQRYYKQKRLWCKATLKKVFVSKPWSIVSLFAGVILLVLTALQTYYTANPRRG